MSDRHVFPPTFHATATGDPFGPALCGFKPEDGEGMWVTQIPSDINCVICREMEPKP